MVIGIIGAGLSGLIAGRELSRAGHDVTVLEKSRGFGGRLATRYESDNPSVKFDHGIASFEATNPEFKKFVAELMEQDLVMRWGDNRWICNEDQTLMKDPAANPLPQFTAKGGMNRIGRYLSRWVEVKGRSEDQYFGWRFNLFWSPTIQEKSLDDQFNFFGCF
ncbi:MAG: FAD-dependent oxidoreductase [Bacteroidetes bacterium]|nr:FAD-dependent oxidoreductase [Bacteroidota bacterium]